MKIKLADLEVDYALNKSRQPFALESCQSLADSLGEFGQDTPVKVTTNPPGSEYTYKLRIGFRRVTAARDILKWDEIEAVSMDGMSEDEIALENVRENIERENLTYYEECCSLRTLFAQEISIKAIARRMSRSTTWVRCRWLVWDLQPEIVLGIESGDLTPSDISLLIGRSAQEQIMLVQRLRQAKAEGESRETVEATVKRKRSVRNKKDIHQMANTLMAQGREAEKIALLWAAGDIDNDELINYNGR